MNAPIGRIPNKTIPEEVTGTFAILARIACAPSCTIMMIIKAAIPSTRGMFTPGRRKVPPGAIVARESVPYTTILITALRIIRA